VNKLRRTALRIAKALDGDRSRTLRVVTANTITDTQIRELRGAAVDRGDVDMWRTCDVALGGDDADLAMTRGEALTRCAAALNARQGAPR
jgi:hypothetical protein